MDIKDIPTIGPLPFDEPLKPGEYYAAQRNGPAIMAICKEHDIDGIGCVFAESFDCRPEGGGLALIYPYDTRECVRVSKETFDMFAKKANTDHFNWLKKQR